MLSVGQLTEAGCEFVFRVDGGSVNDKASGKESVKINKRVAYIMCSLVTLKHYAHEQ